MTDISKCFAVIDAEGKLCPKARTCYRFTAPSSEYNQSYIEPQWDGKECKNWHGRLEIKEEWI
jgi:hypothetical protein